MVPPPNTSRRNQDDFHTIVIDNLRLIHEKMDSTNEKLDTHNENRVKIEEGLKHLSDKFTSIEKTYVPLSRFEPVESDLKGVKRWAWAAIGTVLMAIILKYTFPEKVQNLNPANNHILSENK